MFETLFIIYLGGIGSTITVSLLVLLIAGAEEFSRKELRNIARICIGSPVWPLIVLWLIYRGIKLVWVSAEISEIFKPAKVDVR